MRASFPHSGGAADRLDPATRSARCRAPGALRRRPAPGASATAIFSAAARLAKLAIAAQFAQMANLSPSRLTSIMDRLALVIFAIEFGRSRVEQIS
jgi:hypothetical protein